MIDTAKPGPKRETAIDVGAQQVGGIYAKAFLAAAEKSGQTAALVDEFNSLADAIEQFPELAAVLASAIIKHEEKSAIVDRVFGKSASPMLTDFLKVIANHGRLDLLGAIRREVLKQYDDMRGRIRVRMSTAVALDGQISGEMKASLRKLLGGEPEIETTIDPNLIGGVVLRVGDTVYDGSVSRQLQQMREQMITRSVHEIQSGRNRFRDSG